MTRSAQDATAPRAPSTASIAAPLADAARREGFTKRETSSAASRRRRILAFVACLVTAFASAAAAQHRAPEADPKRVPPALILKGDPTATADWGASRRKDFGPAAVGFDCRECAAAEQRELPWDPDYLGRPWTTNTEWFVRMAGASPRLVLLSTSKLGVALKDGVTLVPDAAEFARLRRAFPDLPEKPKSWTAHHAAHVWGDRMAALELELRFVLDLDESDRTRNKSPYPPQTHAACDLVLVGAEAPRAKIDDFLFGEGSFGPAGGLFAARPAAVVDVGTGAADATRRRFVYSAATAFQRRLSRHETGLPPWLLVGLAHVMEMRVPASRGADDASGTIPPDSLPIGGVKSPQDRAAFIRELVFARGSGSFDALSLTPEAALSTRSRVQAWSVVQYLVGLDRAKFAALYASAASSVGSDTKDKSFARAVKEVYGVEVATLDEAWRVWVLRDKAEERK